MALTNNTVSIQVTSPVPIWYSSLAHKQWIAPANNATAIAANRHWLGASAVIDPNFSGSVPRIWDAYNGMGVDDSRSMVWIYGNGGHQDHVGNEGYVLDLRDTAPQWVRRWNASTNIPGSAPGTNYSKWPTDGRPTGNHTMSYQVSGEGRWFMPGCGSRAYEGSADYTQWWEIGVGSGTGTISGQQWDWIDLGTNHRGGTSGVYHGNAVFDPQDRHIITTLLTGSFAGIHFTHITAMNGLPQYSNTAAMAGYDTDYCQLAIDPENRVLLMQRHGNQNVYRVIRINTPANKVAAGVDITPTGTPPSGRNAYLTWHPPSQAFVTVNGNNTEDGMWKLVPTISGGTYTALQWVRVDTGFTGTIPNRNTTNGALAGGLQKKFQLMLMPDGSYAAIYWSRWGNPDLYVCRLTGAI